MIGAADGPWFFEIKVDGVVWTHRILRETAIEVARFLRRRNPAAAIVITDLRDGSIIRWSG